MASFVIAFFVIFCECYADLSAGIPKPQSTGLPIINVSTFSLDGRPLLSSLHILKDSDKVKIDLPTTKVDMNVSNGDNIPSYKNNSGIDTFYYKKDIKNYSINSDRITSDMNPNQIGIYGSNSKEVINKGPSIVDINVSNIHPVQDNSAFRNNKVKSSSFKEIPFKNSSSTTRNEIVSDFSSSKSTVRTDISPSNKTLNSNSTKVNLIKNNDFSSKTIITEVSTNDKIINETPLKIKTALSSRNNQIISDISSKLNESDNNSSSIHLDQDNSSLKIIPFTNNNSSNKNFIKKISTNNEIISDISSNRTNVNIDISAYNNKETLNGSSLKINPIENINSSGKTIIKVSTNNNSINEAPNNVKTAQIDMLENKQSITDRSSKINLIEIDNSSNKNATADISTRDKNFIKTLLNINTTQADFLPSNNKDIIREATPKVNPIDINNSSTKQIITHISGNSDTSSNINITQVDSLSNHKIIIDNTSSSHINLPKNNSDKYINQYSTSKLHLFAIESSSNQTIITNSSIDKNSGKIPSKDKDSFKISNLELQNLQKKQMYEQISDQDKITTNLSTSGNTSKMNNNTIEINPNKAAFKETDVKETVKFGISGNPIKEGSVRSIDTEDVTNATNNKANTTEEHPTFNNRLKIDETNEEVSSVDRNHGSSYKKQPSKRRGHSHPYRRRLRKQHYKKHKVSHGGNKSRDDKDEEETITKLIPEDELTTKSSVSIVKSHHYRQQKYQNTTFHTSHQHVLQNDEESDVDKLVHRYNFTEHHYNSKTKNNSHIPSPNLISPKQNTTPDNIIDRTEISTDESNPVITTNKSHHTPHIKMINLLSNSESNITNDTPKINEKDYNSSLNINKPLHMLYQNKGTSHHFKPHIISSSLHNNNNRTIDPINDKEENKDDQNSTIFKTTKEKSDIVMESIPHHNKFTPHHYNSHFNINDTNVRPIDNQEETETYQNSNVESDTVFKSTTSKTVLHHNRFKPHHYTPHMRPQHSLPLSLHKPKAVNTTAVNFNDKSIDSNINQEETKTGPNLTTPKITKGNDTVIESSTSKTVLHLKKYAQHHYTPHMRPHHSLPLYLHKSNVVNTTAAHFNDKTVEPNDNQGEIKTGQNLTASKMNKEESDNVIESTTSKYISHFNTYAQHHHTPHMRPNHSLPLSLHKSKEVNTTAVHFNDRTIDTDDNQEETKDGQNLTASEINKEESDTIIESSTFKTVLQFNKYAQHHHTSHMRPHHSLPLSFHKSKKVNTTAAHFNDKTIDPNDNQEEIKTGQNLTDSIINKEESDNVIKSTTSKYVSHFNKYAQHHHSPHMKPNHGLPLSLNKYKAVNTTAVHFNDRTIDPDDNQEGTKAGQNFTTPKINKEGSDTVIESSTFKTVLHFNKYAQHHHTSHMRPHYSLPLSLHKSKTLNTTAVHFNDKTIDLNDNQEETKTGQNLTTSKITKEESDTVIESSTSKNVSNFNKYAQHYHTPHIRPHHSLPLTLHISKVNTNVVNFIDKSIDPIDNQEETKTGQNLTVSKITKESDTVIESSTSKTVSHYNKYAPHMRLPLSLDKSEKVNTTVLYSNDKTVEPIDNQKETETDQNLADPKSTKEKNDTVIESSTPKPMIHHNNFSHHFKPVDNNTYDINDQKKTNFESEDNSNHYQYRPGSHPYTHKHFSPTPRHSNQQRYHHNNPHISSTNLVSKSSPKLEVGTTNDTTAINTGDKNQNINIETTTKGISHHRYHKTNSHHFKSSKSSIGTINKETDDTNIDSTLPEDAHHKAETEINDNQKNTNTHHSYRKYKSHHFKQVGNFYYKHENKPKSNLDQDDTDQYKRVHHSNAATHDSNTNNQSHSSDQYKPSGHHYSVKVFNNRNLTTSKQTEETIINPAEDEEEEEKEEGKFEFTKPKNYLPRKKNTYSADNSNEKADKDEEISKDLIENGNNVSTTKSIYERFNKHHSIHMKPKLVTPIANDNIYHVNHKPHIHMSKLSSAKNLKNNDTIAEVPPNLEDQEIPMLFNEDEATTTEEPILTNILSRRPHRNPRIQEKDERDRNLENYDLRWKNFEYDNAGGNQVLRRRSRENGSYNTSLSDAVINKTSQVLEKTPIEEKDAHNLFTTTDDTSDSLFEMYDPEAEDSLFEIDEINSTDRPIEILNITLPESFIVEETNKTIKQNNSNVDLEQSSLLNVEEMSHLQEDIDNRREESELVTVDPNHWFGVHYIDDEDTTIIPELENKNSSFEMLEDTNKTIKTNSTNIKEKTYITTGNNRSDKKLQENITETIVKEVYVNRSTPISLNTTKLKIKYNSNLNKQESNSSTIIDDKVFKEINLRLKSNFIPDAHETIINSTQNVNEKLSLIPTTSIPGPTSDLKAVLNNDNINPSTEGVKVSVISKIPAKKIPTNTSDKEVNTKILVGKSSAVVLDLNDDNDDSTDKIAEITTNRVNYDTDNTSDKEDNKKIFVGKSSVVVLDLSDDSTDEIAEITTNRVNYDTNYTSDKEDNKKIFVGNSSVVVLDLSDDSTDEIAEITTNRVNFDTDNTSDKEDNKKIFVGKSSVVVLDLNDDNDDGTDEIAEITTNRANYDTNDTPNKNRSKSDSVLTVPNNKNSNTFVIPHQPRMEGKKKYIEPIIFGKMLGKKINVSIAVKIKNDTVYIPSNVTIIEDSQKHNLNFSWTENSKTKYGMSLNVTANDSKYYKIDGVQLHLVKDGKMSVWMKNVTIQPHIEDKTDHGLTVEVDDGVHIVFSNADIFIVENNTEDIRSEAASNQINIYHLEIALGLVVVILFFIIILYMVLKKMRVRSIKKNNEIPS